jgi:hypothetical protein
MRDLPEPTTVGSPNVLHELSASLPHIVEISVTTTFPFSPPIFCDLMVGDGEFG